MRHAFRVLLVVALAAVGLIAADAHAATPNYVALGDSYTSGPLIPLYEQPCGCLRSTNNYPHLLASALKIALRDASCSGAETEDMTGTQGVTPGPNPPQYDRLDADTSIVTIQIGGNDIGFSSIAEDCFAPLPQGTPCQDAYVRADGSDIFSERVAAAAPRCRRPSPASGPGRPTPASSCWATRRSSLRSTASSRPAGRSCPMSPEDIPWVRAKVKELNAMIAAQAAPNGARYVDIYTPSIGKDACSAPLLRWVEPLVIVGPAAPVHPNITGHARHRQHPQSRHQRPVNPAVSVDARG